MKLDDCVYLYQEQVLLVPKAVCSDLLCLPVNSKGAGLLDTWHMFNLCTDIEDQVPESVWPHIGSPKPALYYVIPAMPSFKHKKVFWVYI